VQLQQKRRKEGPSGQEKRRKEEKEKEVALWPPAVRKLRAAKCGWPRKRSKRKKKEQKVEAQREQQKKIESSKEEPPSEKEAQERKEKRRKEGESKEHRRRKEDAPANRRRSRRAKRVSGTLFYGLQWRLHSKRASLVPLKAATLLSTFGQPLEQHQQFLFVLLQREQQKSLYSRSAELKQRPRSAFQ